RTNMFGIAAALRIQKRILRIEIIKAAFWNDLQNRQRQVAQNANRQFATGDVLLNQQLVVIARRLTQRPVDFAFFPDDEHTNGRALSGRLDDKRKRKCRLLVRADNFPAWCVDAVLSKFLLRGNFVERETAPVNALARVGDAAVLEDLLEL